MRTACKPSRSCSPSRASPRSASTAPSGATRTRTTAGRSRRRSTPLNGHGVADFNGTTQTLAADGTLDDYYDGNGYGGVALIYVDAIVTNDATANGSINNDSLVALSGVGYHNVYFRTNSGSPLVGVSQYDTVGTYFVATAPITVGAWVIVHWRYTNGVGLQIGVNGVWGSVVPTTGDLHATGLANSMRVGCNYNASAFFDGKLAAMQLFDFSPSDGNITNIILGLNSKYGLTIGL